MRRAGRGDDHARTPTGTGEARRQRVLAWAGPIELAAPRRGRDPAPRAGRARAGRRAGRRVGVRRAHPAGPRRASWERARRRGRAPAAADAGAGAARRRCDAIVLSAQRAGAAARAAIERGARAAGALVAVTAGAGDHGAARGPAAASRRWRSGPPVSEPVDDLGAGDVFAAALFVALAGGRGSTPARSRRIARRPLRMQRPRAGAGRDRRRDRRAARRDRGSPAADQRARARPSISASSCCTSSRSCAAAGARREQQAAADGRHLDQRDLAPRARLVRCARERRRRTPRRP